MITVSFQGKNLAEICQQVSKFIGEPTTTVGAPPTVTTQSVKELFEEGNEKAAKSQKSRTKPKKKGLAKIGAATRGVDNGQTETQKIVEKVKAKNNSGQSQGKKRKTKGSANPSKPKGKGKGVDRVSVRSEETAEPANKFLMDEFEESQKEQERGGEDGFELSGHDVVGDDDAGFLDLDIDVNVDTEDEEEVKPNAKAPEYADVKAVCNQLVKKVGLEKYTDIMAKILPAYNAKAVRDVKPGHYSHFIQKVQSAM